MGSSNGDGDGSNTVLDVGATGTTESLLAGFSRSAKMPAQDNRYGCRIFLRRLQKEDMATNEECERSCQRFNTMLLPELLSRLWTFYLCTQIIWHHRHTFPKVGWHFFPTYIDIRSGVPYIGGKRVAKCRQGII